MESAEPKEPAAFTRHVPAPAAAERLWQAYARIDPGRETARSWDEAIEPLTLQLVREDSALITLGGSGIVAGLVAAGFRRRLPPYAVVGAAGAAVAAWVAASALRRDRTSHPLARLLRRGEASGAVDERVDAVLQAFASAIPLFPSVDGETASGEAPISAHLLDRACAPVLFHSHLERRRAAASHLGDSRFSRLVVKEADLAGLMGRVRPVHAYIDLFGANEWEIERAERATLAANPHKQHGEIRACFAVIRWQGERDRQGFTLQQNEQDIVRFIRERRLPVDLSRTRYSQFRNGSHAFKDCFRPR
jgi:hypothetical protein